MSGGGEPGLDGSAPSVRRWEKAVGQVIFAAASFRPRQQIRSGMSWLIPRRLFMTSGPVQSGRVALTFDDGPHPEHTPRLLDALGGRGIPATFFVLGRHAERYPQIVRRMASEGHDVGHHSFTHSEPEQTSARTLVDEARRSSALLASILGRPARLFRPPHGKLTAGKAIALWAARQSIVLWNRDPKDFSCGSAAALRDWFDREAFTGGDVILLHDVHPHAADALDAIAGRVAASRLGFGRISDWVPA